MIGDKKKMETGSSIQNHQDVTPTQAPRPSQIRGQDLNFHLTPRSGSQLASFAAYFHEQLAGATALNGKKRKKKRYGKQATRDRAGTHTGRRRAGSRPPPGWRHAGRGGSRRRASVGASRCRTAAPPAPQREWGGGGEADVACDGGGACGPGESDDGHLQARYHAGGVAERDVLRAMITDVLRVMDGF